jgi:hypothetical protein
MSDDKANLGLATTAELLDELSVRLEMERYRPRADEAPIRVEGKVGGLHVAVENLRALLTPEQLAYRTAGPRPKKDIYVV